MTNTDGRPRVAVLAPMLIEFRPLVRPLGLEPVEGTDDRYHRGRIGDVEIVATKTGIGTQSATMVAEQVLDDHRVDHLIVVGVCGGLGPDLEVGDLVLPEVVIDRPNGKTHRVTPMQGITLSGTIVTSDEFNYPRDILDRFIGEGVLGLDMETGSIATVCEQRGVPWTAFRSPSDHDTKAPVDPAVLGMANPDGSANVKASIKYLARKPWRIRQLARMGRDGVTAAKAAAAAAVRACESHDWGPSTTTR